MVAVLWALLLVPLAAGVLVQRALARTMARYGAVPNRAGITGAQLARALLDAFGLRRVRIERSPGELTDHYDGDAEALRLSDGVAYGRSVAALAIAAHEVSHAVQDAAGSRVYRIRRTVGEPLARIAPFSGFLFIGGFWFGEPVFMIASIAYVAGLVVFALATLPVEIGASRHAVELLERIGLFDPLEADGVRSVLRAAALTYVVGLLRQVGLFLSLVLFAAAAHSVAE